MNRGLRTELGAIPGPDPGACPECGEWVKAGIPHECPDAAEKMLRLAEFLVGWGVEAS